MKLQYLNLDGKKIIAMPFVLEALLNVHTELLAKSVEFNGKKGLIFAGETTCSWRSETTQRQLVNKGASRTMYSNHRRGTSIDVLADWNYINKIAPVMKKHGLVNDLAYWNKRTGQTRATPAKGFVAWDGGHFNWKSNVIAATYPLINSQVVIKPFNMNPYEGLIIWDVGEGGTGGFALVDDGKKRHISQKRAGLASLAVQSTAPQEVLNEGGRTVIPVPHDVWESIPDGEDF
jgi:hypothetical protein